MFIKNFLTKTTLILSLGGAYVPLVYAQDAASGVRGALVQGAQAAISQLGVTGGFLNNPKVKIPLPESLKSAEKMLKIVGMNKQADTLVQKMNAAAEAAVPLAKPVLLNAVQTMTLTDARQILTGGETSVTQFFKTKTQASLKTQLLPMVKKTTDSVGLAQQYNALAAKAAPLGLIKGDAANIEHYVTGRTLDGLYLIIGEEEKKIRANPLAAASSAVQAVFGALKK